MQTARILHEISRDSNAFRQSMGFNIGPPQTSSPSYTPAIPTGSDLPDLPAIPDVQTEFIEAGIPPQMAQSLYYIYYDRARQLRIRSVRQLAQLVRVPGIFSDGVVRTISKTFLQQLDLWKKQVIDRTCAHLSTNQHQPTRRRGYKIFKECEPLLKSYFRRNAYPSATERSTLATWTGLSPRQVEVWFQNNRKRLKNVEPLNRLSQPPLMEEILEDLAHCQTFKPKMPMTKICIRSSDVPKRQLPLQRPPEASRPNPLDHSEHTFLSHRDHEYSCVDVDKPGRLPTFEWPWSSALCSRKKSAPLSEDFIESLSTEFAVCLSFHRVNKRKRDYDGSESTESNCFHPPFYTRLHQGRHPAVVSSMPLPSLAYQSARLNSSFSSIERPRSTRLQRIRSTSSSSVSSSSSSSTPSTPDPDSSIPIRWGPTPHIYPCTADTLAIYPSAPSHFRAFEAFAGPPIPLGSLAREIHNLMQAKHS
ncbi:hypothetical protein Ac2012v2_008283 [Leucoagaricus gongylophorus]